MTFLSSVRDAPLIADASVWINLVATGRADAVLVALERRTLITDAALAELERGLANGRGAYGAVSELIKASLVGIIACAPEDESLFLDLVSGTAATTLEDGEAATLVCSHSLGATAVIDERKATALALRRFPKLEVISTVDLLLAPPVVDALGPVGLGDAIFNALTDARMRVPYPLLGLVVSAIGQERARRCASLPSSVRLAQPTSAVSQGRFADL